MNREIIVSIVCITYNHEKYIVDALNGFLNQETDFAYEILIHDDCSTDKTADIIRAYYKKYPNIIRPILQEENQFSKGVGVTEIVLQKVKGKYIAMCEGDDYWIDTKKLQKQYDYMESHPECTFCFTNGYIEDAQNDGKRREFIPYNKQDAKYYKSGNREFTLNETCEMSFIPTASFMFPTANLQKRPATFFEKYTVGDLKMRLFFTAMGYAYFIDDKTCVYRTNVANSAMTKFRAERRASTYAREKAIIRLICNVDIYSNYKYTDALGEFKKQYAKIMLHNATSWKDIQDDYCKEMFKTLSVTEKIYILFKMLIPDKLWSYLKKIR